MSHGPQTPVDLDKRPFRGQYQEWCRVQYAFAHHDIWWAKDQQFKAAASALALIGGLVGAAKLLWEYKQNTPLAAQHTFELIAGVVVVFGCYYTWSLYHLLLSSRLRASKASRLADDPEHVLEADARFRDWQFPLAISGVEAGAGAVAAIYFGLNSTLTLAAVVVVVMVFAIYGLGKGARIARPESSQQRVWARTYRFPLIRRYARLSLTVFKRRLPN